ncbi:MAG: hypothetical protein QOD03_1316 [Verrucomicrobiota bacterium]
MTRFVLGKSGINSLSILGINPSTADEYNSDPTMDKIEHLIGAWSFNGFLMFNLYPLRASKPKNLPSDNDAELVRQNAKLIRKEMEKSKVHLVWAAWGDAFDEHSYLKACLEEILSKTRGLNLTWKRCESLTKSRNPRHPLSGQPHIITKYSRLVDFDVEDYLRSK